MPLRFLSAGPVSKRGRRGFTMVEFAFVSVLLVGLLTAILMWSGSMLRASGAAIESVASDRSATYAQRLLTGDLANAVPCSARGTSPMFGGHGPTGFSVYRDVVDAAGVGGSDGLADEIVWTFGSGGLIRTVTPGSGACPATGAASEASVVAASVETVDASTPLVSFYSDGIALGSEPDCFAATASCDVTSVRVQMYVVLPDGDPTPSYVDFVSEVETDRRRT